MKKEKCISIKAKLLGIIIPVVLIMFIVLVLISYNVSADIIRASAKQTLKSSVKNQSVNIESWLNENLSAFQMAKATIENLNCNEQTLQSILDGYYGYNGNYPDGLYIGTESGKVIKAKDSTRPEENATDTTWYREGLTRVNMAIGSAYKNAQGENVVSATGIINDNADTLRVISADLKLDRISIIVNSFIDMEGAQSLLIDKNSGLILASRDASLISTPFGADGQSSYYKELAQKLADGNYDTCTIEGNMTAFEEVGGTDWVLVSYVAQNRILAQLYKLRTIMIIVGIVSMLILCVLIERVTHITINPVKKMTDVIMAMAGGDFTISYQPKGNDEIAIMGRSVAEFLQSMRTMIASMGEISGTLDSQAQSSRNISEQMSSAADIQANSMGELNETVDQLSLSVNDIAQNATELAGYAAETKENSDLVVNKMDETVGVSEKGKTDMERVSQALENIEKSVRSLETAVNKVGTASGEIVQITNLIGDIAEETNLLSLNASIEAARAGDAGKGFAVVATQIGALAKNSAESVANITHLINEINMLVEDAVRQAGNSVGDINDSTALIQTAIDTFDIIFNNIQQTNQLIGEVVSKIAQVDQVATNVAAISEEQAASSDEILATSESMLEQAKNISKNSEHVNEEAKYLAESADKLSAQVKQFKI